MREFDPRAWFGTRELDFIPEHFAKANTYLTAESYVWIKTALRGRYAVAQEPNPERHSAYIQSTKSTTDYVSGYPCFEDSKEMIMYELRWAGK